jgi:hypothetical protein
MIIPSLLSNRLSVLAESDGTRVFLYHFYLIPPTFGRGMFHFLLIKLEILH